MASKKVPERIATKKRTTKGRAPKAAGTSSAKSKRAVEASALEAADAEVAATSALALPEAAPQGGAAGQQPEQQTNISTSRGFIDFLVTNRLSLALTSYQTRQLMLIGPLLDGRLSVFQRNFVRARGLWASPQRLYLSSIAQIWRLENVLGPGQLANQQQLHYERLYVPRASHTTGDIDAHELGIDGQDRLIFVNTKYSCLATTDPIHVDAAFAAAECRHAVGVGFRPRLSLPGRRDDRQDRAGGVLPRASRAGCHSGADTR